MNLDLYLAFVLAVSVLIVVPGPTVSLVIANSLTHGPRGGLMTVLGAQGAMAVQLLVVAAGLTTLVAVMAQAFEVLRWVGVAYLLYLGLRRWQAPARLPEPADTALVPKARIFWQGFLITSTNPKVLVFYAAFFPQFVDPRFDVGWQLAVLCPSFLLIALTFDACYALAAGRARMWLREARHVRWLDRITGTVLIGAAGWLALARRV